MESIITFSAINDLTNTSYADSTKNNLVHKSDNAEYILGTKSFSAPGGAWTLRARTTGYVFNSSSPVACSMNGVLYTDANDSPLAGVRGEVLSNGDTKLGMYHRKNGSYPVELIATENWVRNESRYRYSRYNSTNDSGWIPIYRWKYVTKSIVGIFSNSHGTRRDGDTILFNLALYNTTENTSFTAIALGNSSTKNMRLLKYSDDTLEIWAYMPRSCSIELNILSTTYDDVEVCDNTIAMVADTPTADNTLNIVYRGTPAGLDVDNTFTGINTVPTPTSSSGSTQIANKGYVDGAFSMTHEDININKNIPGLTITTPYDKCKRLRVNNIVIDNYLIHIEGTYTGSEYWEQISTLPSAVVSHVPYLMNLITSNGTAITLHQGCYLHFDANVQISFDVYSQVVYFTTPS